MTNMIYFTLLLRLSLFKLDHEETINNLFYLDIYNCVFQPSENYTIIHGYLAYGY